MIKKSTLKAIMVAERAADMILGKAALPSLNAPVWIHPEFESKQR